MTSVSDIYELVKELPESERERLKDLISNSLSHEKNMQKFVTEKRFSSGEFCPHCGSRLIKRNGHKDGRQRYLCLDCGRTFAITTNTILASTKKDFAVWEKYIDCMMNGLSIRKSAERCGIDKATAFSWRHKILDALQNMAESIELEGIVEGDETFFAVSYKGNHNKDGFALPREAHKRGRSVHVRGLSQQQVCVPCAVNRNGLSIAKVSSLGRPTEESIKSVLENRIARNSVLCTDAFAGYKKFAERNNIELIQLKSGKTKKGIYHIQHINNYHSQLKKFIRGFNGVSTKYLNNYLIWNNILNYSKETWTEKRGVFSAFVFTTKKKVLCKDVSKRPALPLLA